MSCASHSYSARSQGPKDCRSRIDRRGFRDLASNEPTAKGPGIYRLRQRRKRPRGLRPRFRLGTMPLDDIVRNRRKASAGKGQLENRGFFANPSHEGPGGRCQRPPFHQPALFMSTLEVEFTGRAICVRGVVRLPRERELVTKVARNMAGEVPVKTEIRYRQWIGG